MIRNPLFGMELSRINPRALFDFRAAAPVTGRSFARLTLVVGLVLFSSALPLFAQSKEYQLKAAFLYNFAKFVEWPERRFVNPQSPFVIGVLGENPFGDSLEKAVRGRRVSGRRIVVKQFRGMNSAHEAHLLFVGVSSQEQWHQQQRALGKGVLVVGETEWFANHGGTISFLLRGDKLRFRINMKSATAEGLKVSSQLQKLAVDVTK